MHLHRSEIGTILLGVIVTFLVVLVAYAEVDHIPCHNQRCQSRVSFCLLTKDCLCDDFEANFTCANMCTKCLNDTYQDCCTCVGLCQASVKEADITKLSNVELFPEPDTEVFKLISLAPAKKQDWHSQTLSFKLHIDIDPSFDQLPSPTNETLSPEFNCTVVYLAQCMAMNKCKQNCNSMGASAFRWFHNACCECIGECDPAPYGDEEAKCEYCSGTDKPKDDQTAMLSDEANEDEDEMQNDESYVEEDVSSEDY